MRLFIAIPFTDEVKANLMDCIYNLKKQSLGGQFTNPAYLSLSLAYITEYQKEEDIQDAMDTVSVEPFEIFLRGYGISNRRSGNIHYSSCEPHPQLTELHKQLVDALAAKGISVNEDDFDLQFTLARNMQPIRTFNPGAFSHTVPRQHMKVTEIALIKSDYDAEKRLVYTELYRKALPVPEPTEEEKQEAAKAQVQAEAEAAKEKSEGKKSGGLFGLFKKRK